MGAIVPIEDVNLNEPGQKAIIAHDGFEEILILSTDLDATSSTGALRFIPLPSEPEVSLAPKGCFEALSKLVRKHNLRYLIQYKALARPSAGEAIELRFYKKIGVHDITVIKVNDALHFRRWVNDFFKQKGLSQRDEYKEVESHVTDYVEKGIPYFVFDFIELKEKVMSIDPVMYQFKCRKLYYPLTVTNIFGGTGRIELFVFAENGRRLIGQSSGAHFQASTTSVVMADELVDICPAINELLGKRSILQAFKYDGKLSFKGDIFEDISIGELRPYSSGSNFR